MKKMLCLTLSVIFLISALNGMAFAASASNTTVAIDSATFNSASGQLEVSGRITANATDITEKGFTYSYTSPEPGYWINYDGCKSAFGTAELNVPFSDVLSGIDPTKTVCYVRAYVVKPIDDDSHGEVIYSATVTVNISTVQTQQPITWGVWFDGVQFGTQLGEGNYAINDGVWQVFSPKSDSKILLSTDYSLCDVRITKINDNATAPTNNTARYDYELVVFSQDFPAASNSTALEINVGGLNLSNGTYVIEYTNKSGNLRFWYPFVIYRNSGLNTIPAQPPINAYYSQNAAEGAWYDNQALAFFDYRTWPALPTFRPASVSKIVVSTDLRLVDISIGRFSSSTPQPTTLYDGSTVSYYWLFDEDTNYNIAEINWSELNLPDGTYMLNFVIGHSDSRQNRSYVFIIDRNYTPPVTPRFSDVPQTHWAYSAIMKLSATGALTGYPDGTFRPNNTVSRSEFAVMMTKALGIPLAVNPEQTFADVKKGSWDFAYVETAKKYLTGYKQGNVYYFKGSENAVREDMAVALVMALGLETQQVDVNELKTIFTDYSEISPDLQKYVLIAHKNGLISGYPDGTFGPQRSITRAEAAALMVTALDSDNMQKVKM